MTKRKLEDNAEKGIIYQASSISSIIYSDKNIKSLLKSYLPNVNIEDIYLFQVIRDHVCYNFINKLKAKLIHETKDKIVSDDKFYVIIEQSINQDQNISSAILLKLYNKNNKNQLEILPVIDNEDTVDLLKNLKKQLKLGSEELKKLRIITDDIPEWYNAQLPINISSLIEIIKLSIKYKSPHQISDNKIVEIMNTPYTEYEKLHQELLNGLKLTDDEGIDQLSLVDKNQDEFVASSSIKKTISWDPTVEDNEGHTIRRKKHKFKVKTKEKDEVEEYFEQCITSWHWDQKIWEEQYFNTNKLDPDKFKELIDKYYNVITKEFRIHIFNKYSYYDCPNYVDPLDFQESLNQIIKGYTFLISYSPNLYNVLREYQESIFIEFSDTNFIRFYNDHPELILIKLIEKRIDNVNIVVTKDQNNIINPVSDDKTDTEVLVDITSYNQENSELKLAGNSTDSSK